MSPISKWKLNKTEKLKVLQSRVQFHLRTAKHYREEARKLKAGLDKAEKAG